MRAATRQARDGAANPAHAREFFATVRAAINKARGIFHRRKRQIMAARFISDSQIATSRAPFVAMRQNPAASGAKLGEQMCEFVSKRAIDFAGLIAQSRIKQNQLAAIIRPSSATFQARVPFDANFVCNQRRTVAAQKLTRDG